MKCSEVTTFLFQIDNREESIASIPPADLDYLCASGYVLRTASDDHDKGVADVATLTQLTAEMANERAAGEQANEALEQDQRKVHSILFHFENEEEKDEMTQRVQHEAVVASEEEAKLTAIETSVNQLIQKKSAIDRMVPYGGEYLSLTDVGAVTLNDLSVRTYRVSDEEFTDFTAEIQATYAELRSIADRASSYIALLKSRVAEIGDIGGSSGGADGGQGANQAPALLWSAAIGLAKLQGDTNQIRQRFVQALDVLQAFDSTAPNKLMAAEIMTASGTEDLQSLGSVLKDLDGQLRHQGVPKELSAGVAATIMAGRRFDGTYPMDRFSQFKGVTPSYEAAAILAVMNVPYDGLNSKFQTFRAIFNSWGYTTSEDTEIASAFLAIGELEAVEVQDKLKYIVEQLKNYLEYPLVAAAILASIPVFEAHEVLDLMEKAVTLLSAYATGLERSESVALAVRMIHGVRNELVKQIDSTAKVAATPIQFMYGPNPGFFVWYYALVLAHSSYLASFSSMGGFHPAHSHGVGGFAG